MTWFSTVHCIKIRIMTKTRAAIRCLTVERISSELMAQLSTLVRYGAGHLWKVAVVVFSLLCLSAFTLRFVGRRQQQERLTWDIGGVVNWDDRLRVAAPPITPLPNIIHQSWMTHDLPERFQAWAESWKRCFPNWTYKLWTDHDNREFIRYHYPWFLEKYDGFPVGVQRADSVRYLYLFHYGGVYADLDAECLKDFSGLLHRNHSIWFGDMESGRTGVAIDGYIENSFMISRPRHPFWLEVIHNILLRTSPYPGATTGPDVLMDTIQSYKKRRKSNDIFVFPANYFNPFTWANIGRYKYCKDFNKMSDKEVELCKAEARNNSYVIQYHTQTWGQGKPNIEYRG